MSFQEAWVWGDTQPTTTEGSSETEGPEEDSGRYPLVPGAHGAGNGLHCWAALTVSQPGPVDPFSDAGRPAPATES